MLVLSTLTHDPFILVSYVFLLNGTIAALQSFTTQPTRCCPNNCRYYQLSWSQYTVFMVKMHILRLFVWTMGSELLINLKPKIFLLVVLWLGLCALDAPNVSKKPSTNYVSATAGILFAFEKGSSCCSRRKINLNPVSERVFHAAKCFKTNYLHSLLMLEFNSKLAEVSSCWKLEEYLLPWRIMNAHK